MRGIALITILVVGLTSTTATIARFGVIPGQQPYSGSGVGPLRLFRSSTKNAEIVNEGLKGHPIARMLALAYGDELPELRDDIIRRVQANAITQSSGSAAAPRAGGLAGLFASPYVGAVISPSNWRMDRENQKKETEDPYKRSGLFSSLLGGGSSSGGGGGGGLLSSFSRFTSGFLGGGSSGGSFSSSSSSSSSGGSGGGFRITAGAATRSPYASKTTTTTTTTTAAPKPNSVEDGVPSADDLEKILANFASAASSTSTTENSERRR